MKKKKEESVSFSILRDARHGRKKERKKMGVNVRKRNETGACLYEAHENSLLSLSRLKDYVITRRFCVKRLTA